MAKRTITFYLSLLRSYIIVGMCLGTAIDSTDETISAENYELVPVVSALPEEPVIPMIADENVVDLCS